MATTTKPQKDKPRTAPLIPRPTAASAARAARNALNRNLAAPQSPSRPVNSPKMLRRRTSASSDISARLISEHNITNLPEPENKDNFLIDKVASSTNETYNVEAHPLRQDIPQAELVVEHIQNEHIQNIYVTDDSTTDPVYHHHLENKLADNAPEKPSDELELDTQQSQLEPQLDCLDRPKTPQIIHNIDQPKTLESLDRSEDPQPPTSSRPQTPQHPQNPENRTPSLIRPNSKSRPDTPESNNNLQRANSLPSSRPQTPHIASVPSTIAPPVSLQSSRPSTPGSRTTRPKLPNAAHPKAPSTTQHKSPNTAQSKITNGPVTPKPKTPSSAIPVPSGPRNIIPNPLNTTCPTTKEDIKSVFTAKRKEFHSMKKELDAKQQAILQTYNNLRNIMEQLAKEGADEAEEIQMEDMVVINVSDWTTEEVTQLCRDVAVSAYNQNALQLLENLTHIDEKAVIELDDKITNMPSKFADLCLQAFTARQEVIDWIKEVLEQHGEGRNQNLDKIALLNGQGLELYEALRHVKAHADSAVNDVSKLSKSAFLERRVLMKVGESLASEIARLREQLERQAAERIKETHVGKDSITLLETQRQLEEERAARNAAKDKLLMTETQLRQTRARVTKMDRQLREAEASIISLTATVKSLEDQNRQREVLFEARARKLKETVKTAEVTNNQITQQRDKYQAEVQKLTEKLEQTVAQNKAKINELQKEFNKLTTALEEQCELTLRETEKNNALEEALMELRNAFDDYKMKHPEIDTNPELPTEREIDLWAELQATKDTLRVLEEEVTACKREKVRFLETLTKISETEDKVGMQQKLAAELLSKEEIIANMQIQIRELTKNVKHYEQKMAQYEQYVRDLQAHTRAVANCQESPNGISYQDLQQEIMNLRMNLLDAVQRNEELTEELAQKEQQIEQQDKTSRAQARIIKVREELINMLKNKETEQSKELAALQQDVEYRMKIVEEVNQQIASKAEEIQELFVTLENRQQQIHRLEKIVLALEEQQRRAQAQRTRYEEKIAALEHELSAGVQRERRFLFF